MRILFVAPWVPSRVRPRSLGLLSMLAAEHDVYFTGLTAPSEITADLEAVPLAGRTLVPLRAGGALARTAGAMVAGRSLQAAYVASPGMVAAVARAAERFDPDVVHMNVIRSAPFMRAIGRRPVVFDFDEYRSEYYRQLSLRRITSVQGILGRVEHGRMARLEVEAEERSNVILLSSPSDLNRSAKAVLVRSPHQVPDTAERAVDGTLRVLFVGRMSYAPNSEGLARFVDGAWPAIRAQLPGAQLDVVGERPPRSIVRLEGNGVRVWGAVPDVAPYYSSAAIAIVPIAAGTGVQMKLIQAMAAGVPTVATVEALERAGVTAGEHALAAESADEWASAVVELATDLPRAERIARAGRTWAGNTYGRDAIRTALMAAYAALPSAGEFPSDRAHR